MLGTCTTGPFDPSKSFSRFTRLSVHSPALLTGKSSLQSLPDSSACCLRLLVGMSDGFVFAGRILMQCIHVICNVMRAYMSSGLNLITSPYFNRYQVSCFRGISRCTNVLLRLQLYPYYFECLERPCVHSTHLHRALHC